MTGLPNSREAGAQGRGAGLETSQSTSLPVTADTLASRISALWLAWQADREAFFTFADALAEAGLGTETVASIALPSLERQEEEESLLTGTSSQLELWREGLELLEEEEREEGLPEEDLSHLEYLREEYN